jgi:hypothetical protein
MSPETYISILRAHGEYVAKLATGLTTTLKGLEELLHTQAHDPETKKSLDHQLAELQRLLTTEADLFCRRLQAFIEQTGTPPTDGRQGAAESPLAKHAPASSLSATNKTE